ncbi:hypothetical protein [Tropicibacter alexandrii]|uniref:hypothetical protein n=1 Tax=Tropicibacter alexandrii TaxID=2267683 RepID=UPI000EF50D69|nr:hypothetical protein [Tropicibacter alexandrii]
MWDWLQQNGPALNVMLNAVMLLVWGAYLQLFWMSFQRANRAVIHISRAAEDGRDARLIVSNMGSEAVYILAMQVRLTCGDRQMAASVTDKVERSPVDDEDFRDRTLQGPLAGGDAVDVGGFRTVLQRAEHCLGEGVELEDCSEVEVTVIVAAQQAHKLLGGYKRYRIHGSEGNLTFDSEDVLTRQIRSWRHRRQLRKELTARNV